MTQRGPWSVKGIDNRAREIAREAAREEGMTLGAYLNRLILEEDMPVQADAQTASARPSGFPPKQEQSARTAPDVQARSAEPSATALDRLTRRIEAAEARSTLAITGIDQSVVGLLSRLENTEHNQQAMGGHFEGVMDDIQKTYEALNIKVKRIEEDDSSATNLRALKALEDALGKLASHVYEENELVAEETGAIKARVESGLGELSDRMANIDAHIDDKLETVAAKVEKAELRTEGSLRHLADRFTSVELDVADKISHVHNMSGAMDRVYEEVTGSLSEVNTTLGQMQERLSHAEGLTDKAMHTLETRLEALDERLKSVQNFANEEVHSAIQRQFEERFESLSQDLKELVAATRAELAEEIETAAKSVDAEVITQINEAINHIGQRLESNEEMHAQSMEMVGDTVSRITDSVDQRLTANQDQQGRAIEQVSQQVTRISEGLNERLEKLESYNGSAENNILREEMIRFTNTLDERLEYLEDREDATFERVSSEIVKVADKLDQRVIDSEKRFAKTIEQVSSVTNLMEQRQSEALKAFAAKMDGTQKRQDARLTNALSTVSDRLERMQEHAQMSMSPVQKAISALAQRLEALEDFSSPPYADREMGPAIPAMITPEKIDTKIDTQPPVAPQTAKTSEPSAKLPDDDDDFMNPVFKSSPDEPDESDIYDEGAGRLASDLEVDLPDEENNTQEMTENTADFEPGYQSWADDANALLDTTFGDDVLEDKQVADVRPSDRPPPIAARTGHDLKWSDGREETRDSDIFEEEFAAASFEIENDLADTFELNAEAQASPYKDDYIAKARKAARNAATSPQSGNQKKQRAQSVGKMSDGMTPKRAGLAALATVAVVGTAGALYMRGQNAGPAISFDESPKITTATITPPVLTLAEAADVPAAETVDPGTELQEVDHIQRNAKLAVSEAAPDPRPELIKVSDTGPRVTDAIFTVSRIPKTVSLGQAAREGNPVAQYEAGMADLRSGSFVTGADWLRQAADQGLAVAQHELAILHENGTGTTRDFIEARRWNGAAANGGHVEAMYEFATYNINGEGGPVNAQIAAEWFRKAAEYGHANSQFNLAQLYTLGSGVTPSQVDALFWFELAASIGDLDARQAANELVASGNVSQEAAAQVRQRVSDWRPVAKNARANGIFGPQPWNINPGNQILAVQQVLSALGYSVGTPDGIIGEQTRAAISSFERISNLTVTGQINDRLIDALNTAADAERRRT